MARLIYIIAIVIIVAAIIYSYLQFFALKNETTHIIENGSDFPLNEDGRLIHDFLLYQNNAACAEVANIISQSEFHIRETRAVSNALYEEIFGRSPNSSSSSACSLACLDMGSPARYITHVIPEKQYHFGTDSEINVHDWYNDVCEMKEVGFGTTGRPFTLYFLEKGINRILIQHYVPENFERVIWVESHIGHKFEVVDTKTEQSLGIYEVTHDSFYMIGQFYSGINPDISMSFRRKFFEVNRHWRVHEVVKRTFTELGFQRGRLPPDLFNYLSTYYYNNQYQYMLEEGHDFGLGTNYWEQDSHVIDIPFRIKVYLFL